MYGIEIGLYFTDGRVIAYSPTKIYAKRVFKNLGFKYSKKQDLYYRDEPAEGRSIWARLVELELLDERII